MKRKSYDLKLILDDGYSEPEPLISMNPVQRRGSLSIEYLSRLFTSSLSPPVICDIFWTRWNLVKNYYKFNRKIDVGGSNLPIEPNLLLYHILPPLFGFGRSSGSGSQLTQMNVAKTYQNKQTNKEGNWNFVHRTDLSRKLLIPHTMKRHTLDIKRNTPWTNGWNGLGACSTESNLLEFNSDMMHKRFSIHVDQKIFKNNWVVVLLSKIRTISLSNCNTMIL